MNGPTPVKVDLNNVQGLIGQGYITSRDNPTLPVSCFLLFRFGPDSRPREFLKRLTPLVTSVTAWRVPREAQPKCPLNVGLSYSGIQALRMLDWATTETEFPSEFREGPPKALLGDYGPSAAYWSGAILQLDCLVTIWGPDTGMLDESASQVEDLARQQGVESVYTEGAGRRITGNFLPDGQVHFGFRDGLSGPRIFWADDDPDREGRADFRHFILGYSNWDIPSSPSPAAHMDPRRTAVVDFVRDGSYLAFRVMRQDVAGFFDYLDRQLDQLPADAGSTKEERRAWLKARLLGRWPNGNPVALRPDAPGAPLSPAEVDVFDYKDDLRGLKCPMPAHIRIVNPRGRELHPPARPVPMILRRGTPYGKPWSGVPDDVERGMIGLFLCASLNRQFEKLLKWINQTDFSDEFADQRAQDVLLGNTDYPGASTKVFIPHAQGDIALSPRPTFVHTKGTAYFLVPSMATLKRIGAP